MKDFPVPVGATMTAFPSSRTPARAARSKSGKRVAEPGGVLAVEPAAEGTPEPAAEAALKPALEAAVGPAVEPAESSGAMGGSLRLDTATGAPARRARLTSRPHGPGPVVEA